jgi:fucose 4-O-acetylase-like acetyltransferase
MTPTVSNPLAGRRLDLDAAKGLAIVLVVAGHVVARDIRPLGNDWYPWATARLYAFHMAFFFFLAGWVFFLQPLGNWQARWWRTARRLLPAYGLFAALVFVAKGVAVTLLPVDRPVGPMWGELLQQLMYPTQGFASFLWFIVVLLQIQFAAPAIVAFVRHRWVVVVAFAAVLHVAAVAGQVSELLALNMFCRYLLFFMLGGVVAHHTQAFAAVMQRWVWGLLLLGALLVWVPVVYLPTAAGLLSLPVLMGLTRSLHQAGLARWLVFLGINSFTIYLMNSLCMGLVRALVLRTTGWDGALFPLVAALLVVCGLGLPVLAQRVFFSRVPALDRITR